MNQQQTAACSCCLCACYVVMILLTTTHLPPQLNQPTSHLPPHLPPQKKVSVFKRSGPKNVNSGAKVKLQTIIPALYVLLFLFRTP